MHSKNSGSIFVIQLVILFVWICGAEMRRLKMDPTQLTQYSDHVQNYLMEFGYLPKTDIETGNLRTESQLIHAIKELQEFGNIPVTGELDENTRKLILRPRCGVPDNVATVDFLPHNDQHRRNKRFLIQGSKWPQTKITWSLVNKTMSTMDTGHVRRVLHDALDVWARSSTLTFQEVNSPDADIQVLFAKRYHGDGYDFDGPGSILAHAFYPGTGRGGDAHFDEEEFWNVNEPSPDGTNLMDVAVHEFGHSLGLGHSSVEQSIMFPFYRTQTQKELPEDDRIAIQQIYGTTYKQWGQNPYGPKPTTSATSPIPTTTTTTTTTTRRPLRFHPNYDRRERERAREREREQHRQRELEREREEERQREKDRQAERDREREEAIERDRQNEIERERERKVEREREHREQRERERQNRERGRYPYSDQPRRPSNPRIYTVAPREEYTTKHNHHYGGTEDDRLGFGNPTNPRHPNQYPAEVPRYTTVRPRKTESPRDGKPDTCNTTYDAISMIRGELFIFKNRYLWRIGEKGIYPGYPHEINRLWDKLPSDFDHVDAVYENKKLEIVFFIGKLVYIFNSNHLKPGYPRPLTDLGLPPQIEKIDAALIWGHNNRTYLYSGTIYWRFDEDVGKVELDYPRDMSMWRGIGHHIDTAFQWKDGKTYFFKGKGYWLFNDYNMRVAHAHQRSSAQKWMGCEKYHHDNHDNEDPKHNQSLVSSGNVLTSNRGISLVLSHILLLILSIKYNFYN